MAKKDFTQVLKESEKQAEPEETIVRATFIVEKELLNKIKDIAYWERLTQKDLMREAMEDLIEKYNKRIEGRK